MDRAAEHWRNMAADIPLEKRLSTIVDSYVSAAHRDDPGRGCAVPTLGAEIARESAKTRKAFAAKLDQMIDLVADQIPDVPRKTARRLAMGTMATMMGALVMSRVAGSGEMSDEILASGREAALARAAKPVAKKARAKAN
jgi:TetR/AcrR family transcriptional repressor of nem operon